MPAFARPERRSRSLPTSSQLGLGAAAAVIDTHGELVAFPRSDGCTLASINNDTKEAFTAAREGVPSRDIGERSGEEGFPLTNFEDRRYTGWGGGLPIVRDGAVIGAVGVSGLSGDEDIALAQAGIDSLNNANPKSTGGFGWLEKPGGTHVRDPLGSIEYGRYRDDEGDTRHPGCSQL